MTSTAQVSVAPERLARWVENFSSRHGVASLRAADGVLHGEAADGSTFAARLPFGEAYAGGADVAAFVTAAAAAVPDRWGVLLVRKGGFAVARLDGLRMVESKVGQRHVQGRSKAGGQSQQRFARRRDNQARQAYEAAADHAARILGGLAGPAGPAGRVVTGPVVTGGDRTAVDDVLADARLRSLRVTGPWLAVPDPRRGVLEQAVRDACAAAVEVRNA